MKHLVVIDADTIIVQSLLNGGHDGLTTGRNPLLDCTSIEDVGPYMSCTRDLSSTDGSHQKLLIPHHAIAYAVAYSEQEGRPFGFAAAAGGAPG